MKHILCKTEDLKTGEMKTFNVKRQKILVMRNSENEFSALNARCPHQGADMSHVKPTYKTVSEKVGEYKICKSNEIIRCPWHGFEYDIKTGRSVIESNKLRMRKYDIFVENGNIVVKM